MIFKTFNNGIDKSIAKIGIFNKSLWAMQQDLKHGNGLAFSIFGGQSVTNKDRQAIFDFNSQLEKGVKPGKAWATTMSNCSIAAQTQARECMRAKGSLVELANGLKTTTISAKAGAIALKAFAIAGNILMFMAISKGIQIAIKWVSNYINRFKIANEATKEAVSTLKDITSEIETLDSKIKDLNTQIKGLDPITDAEEIANLKAETAELETQLAILKEKERIAKQDANDKAVESLSMRQNSKYQSQTVTSDADTYYGGRGVTYIVAASVTKDQELINAINAYDEYKEKVEAAGKEQAKFAKGTPEWNKQQVVITKYSEKMDDARAHANELANTLEEQRKGLDKNTESGKALADRVDNATSAYTNWLNIINHVTEALEKQKEAEEGVPDTKKTLSISETIDHLNTQLKPTLDSLKSAYQDIFTDDGFTLENVDISMLGDIKSKIDSINENKELGVHIDYAEYENLAKVLTDTSSSADDVHKAFNSFATDIVNSLNPALSQASGENWKLMETLLESMGVQNAEEVLISALGYSYAEYTAAVNEFAEAKKGTTAAGRDLANMTDEKINGFIMEQAAAGSSVEALVNLQLKKLLVNDTKLDTSSDIEQIMNLASVAGMGADVLAKLANAKSVLSAVESGKSVSLKVFENALEDAENAKKEALNFKPVEVDWAPKDSSKDSKSGGSEKDPWLEEYKRKLKELENMLAKGRRICPLPQ